MISALSNNGVLCFKVFTERFKAPVLLDFMRRLERQFERPLVLICDGHPVHKSKAVRDWLKDRKGRITQEFLPPYSPELNPDEFLNQDVKANAVRRKRPHNREELLWNVRSYLQSTKQRPSIVRNYFRAPTVQYASIMRKRSYICVSG